MYSLIWLKLRMKNLGLRRRGAGASYADDDTVKAIIIKKLRTSNQLYGYRAMWRHICQKYKIKVKRYVNQISITFDIND